MIIFHCFPTKEPITPDSPFFADNIKPITTNTELIGFNVTDLSKIALHKMEPALSFDTETHAVKNCCTGKTHDLTALDPDVRTVLAVTFLVEHPRVWDPNSAEPFTFAKMAYFVTHPIIYPDDKKLYFAFPEELHSRRALRTLQALPLEIHFAISYDEYQKLADEIVSAEEAYIEEMEAADEPHEELDELLRNYGFTVIADGVTYLVGQPHAGSCIRLTGLGTDDFAEADEE